MLFSNKVIAYGEFDWLTQIEWLKLSALALWKALVFIVGAATVVVSARLNWLWWKRVKPLCLRGRGNVESKSWLELYAFGAVVGILISAALSPITFSYWHLILVYPFAILPILIGIHSIVVSKESTPTTMGPRKLTSFVQRYTFTSWVATWFTLREKRLLLLKAGLGYLLVLNLLASHDSIKYSYDADYVQQTEQYLIEESLISPNVKP